MSMGQRGSLNPGLARKKTENQKNNFLNSLLFDEVEYLSRGSFRPVCVVPIFKDRIKAFVFDQFGHFPQ